MIRVFTVSVTRADSLLEQTHATEPAVGSVLKSTHLVPARRTLQLGQIMRSTAKIVAGVAFALALFVSTVFVESSIRSCYAQPMTIGGLPIKNASVTGTWMPDFLWAGKAWRLEIKSEDDLELSLDDKVYIIPKGSHEIYSNHDHTNTGKFGSQEFWGYPVKVEVRPLDRMP